jgi:hypothetical protein
MPHVLAIVVGIVTSLILSARPNLAPGSLDGRRELAIELRDDEVVASLQSGTGRLGELAPARSFGGVDPLS